MQGAGEIQTEKLTHTSIFWEVNIAFILADENLPKKKRLIL